MKLTSWSLAVVVLLVATSTASAQWSVLDDFETSTLGDLGTQGGWTTTVQASGDYQVATDPAGGSNQVMQFTSAPGANGSYIPLGGGIADGTTGTVFFRMRTSSSDDADAIFGASDVAAPGGFGAYEGYMRLSRGNIDVRSNPGLDPSGMAFNTGGPLAANEWYNVWLVLDNSADMTDMYISQGNAPAALLVSGHFRNGTTDPLINLYARVGDPRGTLGFLDDVYLDTSGSNLSLPVVPEPASAALLVLGACSMLLARRRRG